MSPTISRAAWSGTAFRSACISRTSTIDASSTTSRSQSMGRSASRRKPPEAGSTSSSRWMVRASNPDASVMRRAALPVGAQRTRPAPLAARMRRMALTMVVLPTPGPPVTTSTLEARARRTAALWLGARESPVRSSIQGRALSGSIRGQGRGPAAMRSRRPAMPRSAPNRPARKTQGVSPTRSATTLPSASSSSTAARTRSSGASSSDAASGSSSPAGRPQWPSSMASVSAWPTPARMRTAAVFSMPSRMAMASAVLKPMPRMSRASR